MIIEEDYVSFETAKLLKEKGFNEPCRLYYDKYHGYVPIFVENSKLTEYGYKERVRNDQNSISDFIASAPSLYVAMKWLRKVHHCVICITPLTFYCGEIVSKWGYCVWADDNTEVDEESSPRLESYEDACEAAIRYCLENLI